MKSIGKVFLTGAGPGAHDLITLRGYRALQEADVILYDALISEDYFSALGIRTQRIFVGKRAGHHSASQEQIQELMIREALSGKNVVRLKGGDPMLFGRAGEEILSLMENQIPFEIIPGVSSLNASAAEFALTLTHRGVSDSLLLIQGHNLLNRPEEYWHYLADYQGTIAVFMGASVLPEVCHRLLVCGMDPQVPVALCEGVSMTGGGYQIVSLSEAANGYIDRSAALPGLILIGRSLRVTSGRQTDSSISSIAQHRSLLWK